jgi:hypothetical protein
MSTDSAEPMSEAELVDFLRRRTDPLYAHAAWQQEETLEARMRQGGEAASEAYLDLGQVWDERLESLESRLLLLAGAVCVHAGRADLWSTIWRVWRAGELVREDEFAVLREMTARARAGERSLIDEEATVRRWKAAS